MSRLCEEIDERVKASRDRPLEGDCLYVWLDTTYVKVRRNHRIVSPAVIIADGVDTDGQSEMLGMGVGHLSSAPARGEGGASAFSSTASTPPKPSPP